MPARSLLLLLTLTACGSMRSRQPATTPPPPALTPTAPAPTNSAPSISLAQYPSISPDGSAIVFAAAGDLWSIPSSGGVAQRLTSHPSDETRSAFSPDGATLAFESERDGPRNLYTVPLAKSPDGVVAAGQIRRITTSDRAQTLASFSSDSKSLYFYGALDPSIFRGTRMYSAPISADAPTTRLSDAFGAAPRPSPDGKLIAFYRNRFDSTRPAYTGEANSDVYTLEPATGTFKRLTSDTHNDADAFILPDNSIVFVSARSGQNNIWRLKPGATDSERSALTQVTNFKPEGQPTIGHGVRDFNLSPGGWTGVFCVWDTMYTINFQDEKAAPRTVAITANPDAASLDFQRMNLSRQVADAALSPDGKTLATIARGQIFIRSTEKDRPTRRVTNNAFRARDLAWTPDGRVLLFASDDTGNYGIYAATVALTREDLAGDDKPKDDKLPDRKPPEKPADPAKEPPGTPAEPPAGKPDPKPDPKDAAAPAAAQPETSKPDDPKPEAKSDAKPDAKTREKKPDWGKRWADSITFTITPLSVTKDEQRNPLPSPDGKKLLITRSRGDLILLEIELTGNDHAAVPTIKSERMIVPSWNEPDAQWASDSRHIVYAIEDTNYNSDIWLLDTATAEAKPANLTRHPDTDRSPRLSADGKVLYFLSERNGDNGQDDIYAVNLDRRLDGLRPYELAEYFKDAAEKAKKRRPVGAPAAPASAAKPGEDKPDAKPDEKKEEPAKDEKKDEPKKDAKPEVLTFDTDDAYLRVRRLTSDANASGVQITPGGERVLYTASSEGATQLLSVDYKNAEKKTVFAGGASNVSVNLAGDKVLFISGGARPPGPPSEDVPRPTGGGEAYLGKPAGGETEKLAIDAPVTIDIAAQQKQKFLEAARIMGNGFYHYTLKGLDWAALTNRYLDLAIRTRTDPEFNRVFLNMLGELNGSHVGISGGRDTQGQGQPVGYLGIDTKPAPGGFTITRVIKNGPADRKTTRLNVGDLITAINGKPVAPAPDKTPATDLSLAMAGTSGQETLIQITPVAGGTPKLLLITPQSAASDAADRYRDEVARNRARVDELSGGKLGYLHIRAMDMASVRDFERDLFAAADGKLGLIIDVRDNGGGSTADILLSSLTAPRHAYTAARGVDPTKVAKDAYPRDRRLIYGYAREITVLCNQNSFSNAEIFSHSIKTTKRGKLVGVPTFGAVISTGAAGLIDGTTIRTPFRGWYLPDGKDMENNGAVPDIIVPISPEDECANKDPQIEAAVKELLTRAKEP